MSRRSQSDGAWRITAVVASDYDDRNRANRARLENPSWEQVRASILALNAARRSDMAVEAADLMRRRAAARFDASQPCGPEANMAKYLASEASWQAGEVAMSTLGGYGLASEYDVERKWRETRLFRTAPVTNNLVLSYVAERVLHLPRSY